MGRVFGGNVDFNFNGTQIESWMDTVTINFNVPAADITSFSDGYQNAVPGKKNATIEIAGAYDNASSGVDEVIFEAIGTTHVTTELLMAGGSANANNPSYECTASGLTGTLVTDYSISLPVGGEASFTASLQNSGSTTREVN